MGDGDDIQACAIYCFPACFHAYCTALCSRTAAVHKVSNFCATTLPRCPGSPCIRNATTLPAWRPDEHAAQHINNFVRAAVRVVRRGTTNSTVCSARPPSPRHTYIEYQVRSSARLERNASLEWQSTNVRKLQPLFINLYHFVLRFPRNQGRKKLKLPHFVLIQVPKVYV